MHEYERLEAYQVKKNLKRLEETLRKKIGVSERGFGRRKDRGIEREIDRKELRIARGEYIGHQ